MAGFLSDSSEGAPVARPHKPLRIGMVAGEASGDTLGAGLIRALRQKFPDSHFEGIGGERMLAEGFQSFYSQDRLAVMGLVEPLKRLPELLNIRKSLRQHFLANPPDVFIGIDSPDFNLDLELALKRDGIKTAHYVSPSVWAWRKGRIKKIAKAVDLMLTLLPFEAAFYRDHRVPVRFVGHPLADILPLESNTPAARAQLGLEPDHRYIALLPGSRAGEVESLAPVFLEAARWCRIRDASLKFLIPAASPFRRQQIEKLLASFPDLSVQLFAGQSHQVMAAADVVVMASGTTTLEAMLLKRPMVIAYKMAPLSFAILSRIVSVKYVGLPNLLANEPIVPELLQDNATAEQIGKQVLEYLKNPEATAALRSRYLDMHRELARNADASAAEAIADLLENAVG